MVTPSGAHAVIVSVYAEAGEALVQWSSGDRARFKLGLLRPIPKVEADPNPGAILKNFMRGVE